MCGIIFALNSKKANSLKVDDYLHDAFLASQVRGVDGSGLFQVDREGLVTWYKGGIHATDFVKKDLTKTFLAKANKCPLTVGHVRAATSGAVCTDNSHPFQVDRDDGTCVVGVHNGTVSSWRYREDSEKAKLDSEWIYHMIAKYGFDAFERIDGAFALVWYDTRDPGKVFMTRNKDRPLHYMLDSKYETILGASEPGMLGWVAQRNGFYPPKNETCFYLEPDKIYAFDLEGDKLGKFNSWKRPEYNSTKAYHYPGSNYSSTPSRSPGYDEDFYAGEEGYPWYPPGSRTSQSDMYYESLTDQERTLREVREALIGARDEEFQRGKEIMGEAVEVADSTNLPAIVIDHDSLERAMHLAITDQLKQEEKKAEEIETRIDDQVAHQAVDEGQIFLLDANASTATRGEIEEAKNARLFGMVVRFTGLEFDEDTNSCIGTAETVIEGTPVKLDGEVRFLTEQIAWDKYIHNPSKGGKDYAILVGLRQSENWAVFSMPSRKQLITIAELEKKFVSNPTATVN